MEPDENGDILSLAHTVRADAPRPTATNRPTTTSVLATYIPDATRREWCTIEGDATAIEGVYHGTDLIVRNRNEDIWRAAARAPLQPRRVWDIGGFCARGRESDHIDADLRSLTVILGVARTFVVVGRLVAVHPPDCIREGKDVIITSPLSSGSRDAPSVLSWRLRAGGRSDGVLDRDPL